MILKKPIRSALSIFLLSCFSVAALPLDFFHNHEAEQIGCSIDSNHSCQHKVHVSKKVAFCFACIVHFDKSFTLSHYAENAPQQWSITVFEESNVAAYVAESLLSFLRGPPSISIA